MKTLRATFIALAFLAGCSSTTGPDFDAAELRWVGAYEAGSYVVNDAVLDRNTWRAYRCTKPISGAAGFPDAPESAHFERIFEDLNWRGRDSDGLYSSSMAYAEGDAVIYSATGVTYWEPPYDAFVATTDMHDGVPPSWNGEAQGGFWVRLSDWAQ